MQKLVSLRSVGVSFPTLIFIIEFFVMMNDFTNRLFRLNFDVKFDGTRDPVVTCGRAILKVDPILLLLALALFQIFYNLRHGNLACFKQLYIHFFLTFRSYQLWLKHFIFLMLLIFN